MTDGPNKPAYVPPKLGDQLSRGGMKYDFESERSEVQKKDRQKKDRNRNKGSRRDSNNARSPKEAFMDKDQNVSETTSNGKRDIPNPTNDMVGAIERGLTRLDTSLKDFGSEVSRNVTRMVNATEESKTETRTLITASTETILAETDKKVKAMNAWNYENVKGDVRRALVQIGVGGVIAGVVALGTYLFGKDDDALTVDGRPNQHANGAAARQPRAQS